MCAPLDCPQSYVLSRTPVGPSRRPSVAKSYVAPKCNGERAYRIHWTYLYTSDETADRTNLDALLAQACATVPQKQNKRAEELGTGILVYTL